MDYYAVAELSAFVQAPTQNWIVFNENSNLKIKC